MPFLPANADATSMVSTALGTLLRTLRGYEQVTQDCYPAMTSRSRVRRPAVWRRHHANPYRHSAAQSVTTRALERCQRQGEDYRLHSFSRHLDASLPRTINRSATDCGGRHAAPATISSTRPGLVFCALFFCRVAQTSSPALVERPRDASCLSVVSFSSTIHLERNLLLLVTSASDLPLRTNKSCSLLFGVFTDAWRSVP